MYVDEYLFEIGFGSIHDIEETPWGKGAKFGINLMNNRLFCLSGKELPLLKQYWKEREASRVGQPFRSKLEGSNLGLHPAGTDADRFFFCLSL